MSASTDFKDFLQALDEHPEWREELRRSVLTEELLSLPATVQTLAKRTDQLAERTDQLAERMGQLTERMGQLAERVDQLAERMDQLTERVDQLAERMDQLTERVDQLTVRMDQLAEAQTRMSSDVAWLKGTGLEGRYRDHAGAYFAPILRRVHALTNDELVALVEDAEDAGLLSDQEARSLLYADLVIRGRCKETKAEVYLAVEVSWGVGLSDVRRAADRADLLRKAGKTALPVVAGTWIAPDSLEPAKALNVWQITNGKATAPEAA